MCVLRRGLQLEFLLLWGGRVFPSRSEGNSRGCLFFFFPLSPRMPGPRGLSSLTHNFLPKFHANDATLRLQLHPSISLWIYARATLNISAEGRERGGNSSQGHRDVCS